MHRGICPLIRSNQGEEQAKWVFVSRISWIRSIWWATDLTPLGVLWKSSWLWHCLLPHDTGLQERFTPFVIHGGMDAFLPAEIRDLLLWWDRQRRSRDSCRIQNPVARKFRSNLQSPSPSRASKPGWNSLQCFGRPVRGTRYAVYQTFHSPCYYTHRKRPVQRPQSHHKPLYPLPQKHHLAWIIYKNCRIKFSLKPFNT